MRLHPIFMPFKDRIFKGVKPLHRRVKQMAKETEKGEEEQNEEHSD